MENNQKTEKKGRPRMRPLAAVAACIASAARTAAGQGAGNDGDAENDTGILGRWWAIATAIRRSFQGGVTNITIPFRDGAIDKGQALSNAWPYTIVAALMLLLAMLSWTLLPAVINGMASKAKRKQTRAAFVRPKERAKRVGALPAAIAMALTLLTIPKL